VGDPVGDSVGAAVGAWDTNVGKENQKIYELK